mmetsp:Transcript_33654/g.32680  ORF Transcript_33654/g.32680 Transcript_33654/m.32680 type:complete len:94 (+) Transcript_33654:935-1216(+)
MRKIWVENAEICVQRGAIETARTLYKHGIAKFPAKKSLWLSAIRLEEEFGGQESMDRILRNATEVSKHSFFCLRYAKFLWKQMKDISKAKEVL